MYIFKAYMHKNMIISPLCYFCLVIQWVLSAQQIIVIIWITELVATWVNNYAAWLQGIFMHAEWTAKMTVDSKHRELVR